MLALVWPCAGLLKDHPCAASGSFLGGGSVKPFYFFGGLKNFLMTIYVHKKITYQRNRSLNQEGEYFLCLVASCRALGQSCVARTTKALQRRWH